MPLPADSNGINDMFFNAQWQITDISHWCNNQFNVSPDPVSFSMRFGGLDLAKVTSKVIFTNGDLDPWFKGGFEEDISNDLRVFIVKDGAHHLDLRSDQDEDPESVRNVRSQIETLIAKWIDVELV